MLFWFRELPVAAFGGQVALGADPLLVTFAEMGDAARGEWYAAAEVGEKGAYVVEVFTNSPEKDLCGMYKDSVSRGRFIPLTATPFQIAAGAPNRIALKVFSVPT